LSPRWQAPRLGAWRADEARRAQAVRVEEREVAATGHLRRTGRARILGSPWVQQHRGPMERRSLFLLLRRPAKGNIGAPPFHEHGRGGRRLSPSRIPPATVL